MKRVFYDFGKLMVKYLFISFEKYKHNPFPHFLACSLCSISRSSSLYLQTGVAGPSWEMHCAVLVTKAWQGPLSSSRDSRPKPQKVCEIILNFIRHTQLTVTYVVLRIICTGLPFDAQHPTSNFYHPPQLKHENSTLLLVFVLKPPWEMFWFVGVHKARVQELVLKTLSDRACGFKPHDVKSSHAMWVKA